MRRFVRWTHGGDKVWFAHVQMLSQENLMESSGAAVKRSRLEDEMEFDVEMDTGIPGPPLESRREEGAPTAIATSPDSPPQPDSHEPEMCGQGVHAKTLRISTFWSEVDRTPGCMVCESTGPVKTHS